MIVLDAGRPFVAAGRVRVVTDTRWNAPSAIGNPDN